MSTDPHGAPGPLPDRPNLRHLKDQASDWLVTAGTFIRLSTGWASEHLIFWRKK
jgi:hypothetical protein